MALEKNTSEINHHSDEIPILLSISPTHIVDDREAHGSLIDQLDGAMAWFRERLSTEFAFTAKPQRDVHWEYPLNAIREAVIKFFVTGIIQVLPIARLGFTTIILISGMLEAFLLL